MRLFSILLGIIAFSVFLPSQTFAQFDQNYKPRKAYSSVSYELLDFFKYRLKDKLVNTKKDTLSQVLLKFEKESTFLLTEKIRQKYFIQDDSLEDYVRDVMENIVLNNLLKKQRRIILLSKSPYVNALCYANGIYIVTIGLLGRIQSEDQLAFVLAHEMAHDELEHIRGKITIMAKANFKKRSAEQVRKIMDETVKLEDIEDFKKLLYGISKYNRANELQADSLALNMLDRAGYDKRQSISVLTVLDSSMSLKYNIGAELFLPLHCDEYPFQISWLNDRLSLYSRTDRALPFMYSSDSLRTHPEIEFRKNRLQNMLDQYTYGANYHRWEHEASITTLAEFETIESAYDSKQYDICLFYCLQLLSQYPHNEYIISTISDVLAKLYRAVSQGYNIGQYVTRYTSGYSEELRLVNNLLYNLSNKELGDLAFYFLKNEKHFNEGSRNHYSLLLKMSELTYRYDFAKDLKKRYKERFGQSLSNYKFER
jgi:predicted Zn-dependent protease